MKIKDTVTQVLITDTFSVIIMGRRRVISTSKIKKITAIRKNRNENGIRAVDVGSNPHSNGDAFSRSITVFFDKIDAIIMIIVVIIIKIILVKIKE